MTTKPLTATASAAVAGDDELITVRGLVKRYGDHAAVDGVDLTITRGETYALLGPNGAGKSTTVEILEGHRTRDSGHVSVLGEDPQRAGAAWRARIGIVLQSVNDAAELTVAETLRHVATFYPDPHDPTELLESVGLAPKAKQRVRRLSGGQRRRLDVALGLVGRPEVLFLDEPTTGFDPQARRDFWALLRDVRERENTTVLLTTHYLDEAAELADRLGVIAHGKLIAEDTPDRLGGDLRARATVSWTGRGGRLAVEQTTHPSRLVARLLSEFDGDIPDLQVRRPNLEEVYLQMITAAGSTTPAQQDPRQQDQQEENQ